MSIDTKVYTKILSIRSWEEIKNLWLSNMPEIETPGDFPAQSLLDAYDLVTYSNEAKDKPILRDNKTIRADILREGIFLLHKAFHVAGCSEVHLDNGIISWSISSNYQSSLFAIKGILSMLGISVQRVNGALWIDCFPEDEDKTQRQKFRSGEFSSPLIKFAKTQGIGHEETWIIFTTVLSKLKHITMWPEMCFKRINNIKEKDFTKDRNSLYYKCNYWLEPEDLHNPFFSEDFGNFIDVNSFWSNEDFKESKEFQVALNYMLLDMADLLIQDLGKLSKIIQSERDIIKQTYINGRHKRLLKYAPNMIH